MRSFPIVSWHILLIVSSKRIIATCVHPRAAMPGTRMQEHSGNEKSIVWSAVDFADEEQKPEMFCARFASQEREHLHCADAWLRQRPVCHCPGWLLSQA